MTQHAVARLEVIDKPDWQKEDGWSEVTDCHVRVFVKPSGETILIITDESGSVL